MKKLLLIATLVAATLSVALAQSVTAPVSPWSFSTAYDTKLGAPIVLGNFTTVKAPIRGKLSATNDAFAGAQVGGQLAGGTGFGLSYYTAGYTFAAGFGALVTVDQKPHSFAYFAVRVPFGKPNPE